MVEQWYTWERVLLWGGKDVDAREDWSGGGGVVQRGWSSCGEWNNRTMEFAIVGFGSNMSPLEVDGSLTC